MHGLGFTVLILGKKLCSLLGICPTIVVSFLELSRASETVHDFCLILLLLRLLILLYRQCHGPTHAGSLWRHLVLTLVVTFGKCSELLIHIRKDMLLLPLVIGARHDHSRLVLRGPGTIVLVDGVGRRIIRLNAGSTCFGHLSQAIFGERSCHPVSLLQRVPLDPTVFILPDASLVALQLLGLFEKLSRIIVTFYALQSLKHL